MKSIFAALTVCAVAFTALPALAAPTTFATVSDTNQDFSWTVLNGVGTLNTNSNLGAQVNFSYQNVAVPGWLQGTLSATMLINNGNGIQTNAQAQNIVSIGTLVQSLNQPFVIEFRLNGAPVGANSLLKITIAPNGATTPAITGSGAQVGINSSSATVTETFSSDFLRFSGGTIYSSVIGLNSVNPSISINSTTGLLNNFFASNLLANFSADPVPTPIPEPGSLAALVGGLMVLAVASRRRVTV